MEPALAERLVCPRPHAVTPLVVRADEVIGGDLVRGLAGCPTCQMEWQIEAGVLAFGAARPPGPPTRIPDTDALAAFLALAEPGLIIVADGVPADAIRQLGDTYGARLVVLDASDAPRAAAGINGAWRVPLADGVAAGALLFRAGREADFIDSAVRAVRPGGRIVATGDIRDVASVRVVARDAVAWVGERETASAPVRLQRRAP